MSCRPQFQYSVRCLVFWIWTDWLINQVCVKSFLWVTSWRMSYFHRTLLHDSCSKRINKIRYHHLTELFTGYLSKHIKIIKLWTLHLCPFCFCLIFMCTLHQDGSTVANSRTQISFYLFFKLGVTHTHTEMMVMWGLMSSEFRADILGTRQLITIPFQALPNRLIKDVNKVLN